MRSLTQMIGRVLDRVRLLAAAWLAGYRPARTRRAYGGDLGAWLREFDVDVLDARRVHVDLWVRQLLDAAAAPARYGAAVTALWSFDEQPRTGDPLRPGAAPAAIREALLPEDRPVFDAAYRRALATAHDSLDLTELFRQLEHWRRVALLQREPDRFTSIARRAAERLTGEPVPADEPLAQTRRRTGL